ncbi:MAG TPA: hypothetical protein VFQ43_17055 [Nitrososphaera sp.]|nr:hypothetical protein [Nitrososphaera sp.]
MYKPKLKRVIYIEPISVNSASVENSLPASPHWKEIKIIVDAVSKMYRENVDRDATRTRWHWSACQAR